MTTSPIKQSDPHVWRPTRSRVCNFGDGRIHAFDPQSGEVLGILRGMSGKPLAIDGLWALLVGDAVAGGPDAVWFSAGPDDESHGLLGILRAS
jgi:hypothetical protein